MLHIFFREDSAVWLFWLLLSVLLQFFIIASMYNQESELKGYKIEYNTSLVLYMHGYCMM